VKETRRQLARIIDHTQVRAYATEVDIRELCAEAKAHGFASVTVNPAWVSFCARLLGGADVVVDACVGFPLGATSAHVKVEEARDAVRNGAGEIDMVINVGALKSGYPTFVQREIAAVVKGVSPVPVKVILENSYLNDEEKIAVCRMCRDCGAAYVKTSTGFGQGGATVEDVQLMKQVVGSDLGIKAAGGIRTYGDVMKMLEAGATRIGTSAGIEILDDIP
jgi:deoxyribose-phosphate aldolase